jgi:hypothetical protein
MLPSAVETASAYHENSSGRSPNTEEIRHFQPSRCSPAGLLANSVMLNSRFMRLTLGSCDSGFRFLRPAGGGRAACPAADAANFCMILAQAPCGQG